MLLSISSFSGSGNAIAAIFARSKLPSCCKILAPNACTNCKRHSLPGSTASRARRSQSITGMPQSVSIRLTVLFPEPVCPVSPTTKHPMLKTPLPSQFYHIKSRCPQKPIIYRQSNAILAGTVSKYQLRFFIIQPAQRIKQRMSLLFRVLFAAVAD